MNDKNKFVMFDFGNVLARYVNPKEYFDRCVVCLTQGKHLEEVAEYFNILSFYREEINKEDYKKLNPKIAPYVLGERLMFELKRRGVLDDAKIVKARINGIELIDPEIMQKVEKYDPSVISVIGSQNGQDAHNLFDHLFPNMESEYQIISTDQDINARKDVPEFYQHAANRLETSTSKIALLDDEEKNKLAMEKAGGMAHIFNQSADNLEDIAYEAIESLERTSGR